ncbi:MAG: winged helix-turn-helix domain-containing protein [Acuticoccus sp.]
MLLKFHDYALDLRRAEFRCAGTPVPLEPQVFDLIAYMAQNAGRLVPRAELIEAVWHGRIVSDAAIDSRLHAARVAIGDDRREARWLRTVRGRGLVFEPAVARAEEASVPAAPPGAADAAPAPADQTGGRPSLAVLPFARIGDDTGFAALGDALPHDLIAALSRLRWLFVIARASSFRFGAREDPFAAARTLGVRYALAGALDTFAGRLTVTVELFDGQRGGVVWADRMEGPLDEIHRLRSEIVAAVVAALELRIPLEEAAQAATRAPEALDAWGAYHLGLRHVFRFSLKDNAAAMALFERAIALDPGFARAHAALSFAQFQNAFSNFASSFEADRAAAARTAERAIELDPLDPVAVHAYGRSRWLHGDLDGAGNWLGRAISLNPNHAQSFYARALVDMLAGETPRVSPGIDTAYSLSPFDPMRYGMFMCRAYAAVLSGDLSTGVAWADRASSEPNANAAIKIMAAVANEKAGNAETARRQLAEAMQKSPHYSSADFFAALPFREARTRDLFNDAFGRLGIR